MAKAERPSPEKLAAMEDMLEDIVRLANEKMFQLEGTPQGRVKYADGSYKTKPLIAGWEYFLTGGYVSAKGVPIFVFTPEDDQEYVTVDFYIHELDDYLPMVGPFIGESLGNGLEKAEAAFNNELTKRMMALSLSKDEGAQKLAANPNWSRFA